MRHDEGVVRLAQRWRLSFGGLVVACLFLWLSLTPSLLPRSWLFQGIVSGILVSIGYGIGVPASWSARKIFRRQPGPAIRRNSWLALAAVGIPLTVLFLYLNGEWQRDIRALVGVEQPSPYRYAGVVLVGAAIFAILLGGSRLLGWVVRRISRFLGRWISARLATAIGAVLVTVLTCGIINGLMSFIVDGERAKDAGRELFNQVYERWSRLPAGQRPRLLVFGESLGAYGGEAAFADLADMRSRTNGILFVGPPNSSTLAREFTEARDVGTAEVFPIVDDGRSVRFGDDTASLATPSSPWTSPRTVYLQHPSDPIVWWSPDLMFSKPDWLRERHGSDVLPAMTWYPLVTFWQTTADMAVASNVPAGHGHVYGSEVVDAWAAIAPPLGWSPQKTARLKRIVGE